MICGHERESLIWACSWQGSEDWAQLPVRPGTSDVDVFLASRDPAKLTAIIVELLRDRGLSAASRLDDAYAHRADVQFIPLPNPRCPNANEAIGIYLRANKFDRDLSMTQARAFALSLLDASNVTAQDVERMIGEL